MQIEGLNHRQEAMLHVIWGMDSYEELMHWTHTLPRKYQLEALTLIQLILHETIEEQMVEPLNGYYPDAERIIEYIKSTYNP